MIDKTTIAFTYDVDTTYIDQVNKIASNINSNTSTNITITRPSASSATSSSPGGSTTTAGNLNVLKNNNNTLLVCVSGQPANVVDVKGKLLRANPKLLKTTLSIPKYLLFNTATNLVKTHSQANIQHIMDKTNTRISINSTTSTTTTTTSSFKPGTAAFDKAIKSPPGLSSATTTTTTDTSSNNNTDSGLVDVDIVGKPPNVFDARVQFLVLIDEMSGLSSDSMDMDIRLIPIVAGRKRANVNTIMQDTLTTIYLPDVLLSEVKAPNLSDPNWDKNPSQRGTVFFSGLSQSVADAKARFIDLVNIKKSSLVSKHVVCLSKKLDWLQINHKERLNTIMTNNASLLILPELGTTTNMLTVISDDRVYVERTIRTVMMSICNFYVACLRRSGGPPPTSAAAAAAAANPSSNFQFQQSEYDSNNNHINTTLQSIAHSCNAELILQPNFVEICGLEAGVKSAYEKLINTDFFKMSRDAKFQLELALEHREFINGKKNGKINKIIKMSGSKVSFQENFNGYNMLIEIQNGNPSKALEGLLLLEDEMPAEISFYVPETYHKRIIGVGGKNIQRIMKKYGVYVKFSNAEEFASLGGYFENCDNVIARTPAKNAANLEQLRGSINELITNKVESEGSIQIPRLMHKFVIGHGGGNLKKVESATGSDITFPNKELGSELVLAKGTEVDYTIKMLKDLIPTLAEVQVPSTSKAKAVIESSEFISLVKGLDASDVFVHFPKTYGKGNSSSVGPPGSGYSKTLPPPGVSTDSASNSDQANDIISILFVYFPTRCDIASARTRITEYLASKEVNLQVDKVVSRIPTSSAASNSLIPNVPAVAPVIPTPGVPTTSAIVGAGSSSISPNLVPRTTSFESFPNHFGNRILPPGARVGGVNASSSTGEVPSATSVGGTSNPGVAALGGGSGVLSSYSLFDNSLFNDSRNPKQAHSAPNLRSLFTDFSQPLSPTSPSQTTPIDSAGPGPGGYDMFQGGSGLPGGGSSGDIPTSEQQINLLGATLAATNFDDATSGFSPHGVVGGGSSGNSNSGGAGRTLLGNVPSVVGLPFPLPGVGDDKKTSSIWGNNAASVVVGGGSGSGKEVVGQAIEKEKIPTGASRGMSLSRSVPDNSGIVKQQPIIAPSAPGGGSNGEDHGGGGGVHGKVRGPSRLRNEIMDDQQQHHDDKHIQQQQQQQPRRTPWKGSGTNPLAPSFQPTTTTTGGGAPGLPKPKE